jgi:predicted nucleic acid-binding Zn ribbon protein
MKRLIEIIPKLIPHASANQEKFATQLCLYVWNNSFGNAIRQNAVPIKYNNGILFVEVTDAQWKKELETMKVRFLKQLNQAFNTELIKDINFTVKKS